MGHANEILNPDWDYYNDFFHKEGEDCYIMRRMASAARK